MQQFPKRPNGGGRVAGGGDGRADCDPPEAGGQDLRKVAGMDAADGKRGNLQGRPDRAEEAQTGEIRELLCRWWKGRPAAQIVRTIENGLLRLSQRMRRHADQPVPSHDLSAIGHGQFVLPDVYAVGIGQQGDVRPVVDDGERPRVAGELPEQPRSCDQFAVGQLFVPQLQRVDAGFDEVADHARESLRRFAAIDKDVQPGLKQQIAGCPHAESLRNGSRKKMDDRYLRLERQGPPTAKRRWAAASRPIGPKFAPRDRRRPNVAERLLRVRLARNSLPTESLW